MKKLLIVLGILIAAAAAGIYFLLPTNINWEKYVQEASANFNARTGVSLNIQGKPVFSMKPTPILKLGQIRLGNVKDASYPQMMTAARAEVLFDTASLFRRKIKVKKITLFSPEFYFETTPNGKWNWQTAFFDKAGADSTIGFDSLLMTDGKAEVKFDKYTAPQTWDRVNTEIFADSMQGPFFFEGNFGALSSSFGFSLKVEKFLNGQSPDFSLRLINAPAEASFVFTGKYGLAETDRGMLSGNLTFDVRKPDQFFSLLYPQDKLPPEVFQPVVGSLKVNKTAQTRTTELSDILFQYGSSSATGKLSVRTLSAQEASERQAANETEPEEDDDDIVLRDPSNPSEIVRLNDTPVSQMKIAQNLLPKSVNGSFVFSKLDADPFFDNLSAIAAFMANQEYFSKTKDTYVLKVMFDVANYKKDVIHQLGFTVESKPENLLFKDFTATLPSNAYVSGQATLALAKKPMLSGKMSIEATSINAVLGWLNIPVAEEIPQTLLRQLKADVEFKLASGGIVLPQIKGTLDKMGFSGNFALRNGKRKAVSFTADISELNFTQYFPETSKEFMKKREEFSRLPIKGKIKSLFDRLAFFNEFDLNAKLTTKTLSWADIKAENIKSDFSVVRGQMKINEMTADRFFASSVSLQGEVEGFGSEPKFNDFKINIDAKQLSSLTQTLGISVPRGISPQDKMQLSAKLTGTMMIMDFDAVSDFGAARFSGKGDFKETSQDVFDWTAMIDVSHDNFRNFVRLFSDAYRPVLANPGKVTLKGQVIKNKDVFQLLNMKTQIGENEFTGNIKVNSDAGNPTVDAEISGDKLALLGVLPQMNFSDSPTVDTSMTIPGSIWRKDGVLTSLADDLSFSKKPFDFSFLGKYEATITLKANTFFLNSFVLSDFDSVIKISSDKIVVDVRRALWNKANFGGIFNMTFDKDNMLSARASVRFSNIMAPAKLFASYALDLDAVENLTLNMNVSGNGRSMNALVSSLSGTGTLSFERADLLYFDLERFRRDLMALPNISLDEIKENQKESRMELSRFSSEVGLQDGVLTVKPGAFHYSGGVKNTTPSLIYNYLEKTASADISFSLGMSSVPDIALSVKKTAEKQALLSDNLADIVKIVAEQKLRQKDAELKKEEAKRQRELEAKEAVFRKRLDRLNRIDERLTLATTELAKKLSKTQEISEKVYQARKYLITLENAAKKVYSLSSVIQRAKAVLENQKDLQDEVIDALEERIQKEYFDREREVNEAYNMALNVGYQGAVFDILEQAGEILRQETKAQSAYQDLPGISENINEIKQQIKKIKEIQAKSEAGNIGQEDLTVLAGQAEVELDKIKAIDEKIQEAVKQREKEIAEEERIKKEQEELKRKAEEEAKKAAEEAAAAEKARLEAEERERQRTIVRKDSTQGKAKPKASSKKTTSSGSFLQISEEPEQKKQDEPQAEKQGNSIVIRRR